MGIALQIKSGPLAGQIVTVRTGQSFVIGRTPGRAQFAVPHDNQMSGAHFAVECDEKGSRVIDKESSNGTFLNGARAKEATLANGDEIKSGQTVFVVRIVPDDQLSAVASGQRSFAQAPFAPRFPSAAKSPAVPPRETPGSIPARAPVLPQMAPVSLPDSTSSPGHQDLSGEMASAPSVPPTRGAASPASPSEPPALVIGSWAFQKIPNGWQIQEGLGIQQVVKDAFPSSIGAIEEPLGPGLTLQHYVDAHTKMFREYLRDPKINVAVPPVIHGSVETVALEIQYSPKEGPSIFLRRDYARCGSILGVLTLTTLEKDLPSIRTVYDSVLSAVSFSHIEQA
jgi:pSer/pThr/pTyr-binding forkhead associated (FHA) protein